MKILIVIDKFVDPTHGSGVASWAIDLRDELKRQGQWCEVAGYYKKASEFNIDAEDQSSRDQKLISIVQQHQIDCVISGTSWTAFNTWEKFDPKVIKVATIHGAKESIVQRELLAQHKVDAFIGVSKPVKEIADGYRPSVPVFYVNNGIDLEAKNNGQRKKQILWIGRLQIEQKRAHWLKDIVGIINKHGYTLHIIGGGFVESWLKKRIGPQAVWHNHIDRSDVDRLMRESQAVLFTSCYEGLSISLLEAMKSGCVIIAPDLVRMKAGILNQENSILYQVNGGLFFKKGYELAVESALQRLAKNDINTLLESAYQTLRVECSLEGQAKEYLRIINDIRQQKKMSRCKNGIFPSKLTSLRYRRFGIIERNYQRIADKVILKLSSS